jgi:hypothetical protein
MPQLRTSLSFFRAGVKVYRTPVVERTMIDEPNRKAVVFQFEVPAEQFKPATTPARSTSSTRWRQGSRFRALSFQVIN